MVVSPNVKSPNTCIAEVPSNPLLDLPFKNNTHFLIDGMLSVNQNSQISFTKISNNSKIKWSKRFDYD